MSEPTIYAKAADVLRERGRAIRELANPDGSVCLVGAVNVACHSTHHFKVCECRSAVTAMRGHIGGDGRIAQWNDAHSDDDVFALLAELDAQARA